MGVNSLKPGSSQFSSAVLQQVYKVQRKSLIIQLAHGSASGTGHSLEMFGRSLRLLQRGRLRQEVADLQGQNVSSERHVARHMVAQMGGVQSCNDTFLQKKRTLDGITAEATGRN